MSAGADLHRTALPCLQAWPKCPALCLPVPPLRISAFFEYSPRTPDAYQPPEAIPRRKEETPFGCHSTRLMTFASYHTLRNIVNPIFLYLIATYATMRQNAVGAIFRPVTQLPWCPIINAAQCATVSLMAYGQIMEIFGAECGAEIK